MISHCGFKDILSLDEVESVKYDIEMLEDHWIKRNVSEDLYFYTLGAFTYIDKGISEDQYYANLKASNGVLKEKFGFIHDRILKFINDEIGPAEYDEDLALPGFHIFGYKQDEIDLIKELDDVGLYTNIHRDEILKLNRNALSKYKVVENDLLTFTLAISLQNGGGSVVIWDKDVLEIDSKTEYANKMKSFDPGMNPYNKTLLEEYSGYLPTVAEYSLGNMFYIIGNPLHQIGFGVGVKNNEKRITMQGHALKCDGVWRVHL
jgi:hypothetical protein